MTKVRVLQVLLVTGSLSDVNSIKESLNNSNHLFNLHIAADENKFRSLLASIIFDIIIADYDFPFLSAINALNLALAHQHDAPFICISGIIEQHQAVELVKQGAFDVVTKDRIASLPSVIIKALKEAKILKKLHKAKNQLHDKKIIQAQNEELKRINEAKDRFFSIIAHDLKSPLNSLLGFSSMLNERAKEKKYDDCERIAEIIYQSSTMAVNLLSNLLSWAQTQVGNIEFQPEIFNFSELAGQVIKFISDAALLKNITVINELPPEINVKADQDMLATVMRNLLNNAIKFTHPGGTVTISCELTDAELRVSVKDTGTGIPMERINGLFQIGNTYSTYGTSRESGTGLGLILCREFIAKHKGRIWAESNTGTNPDFPTGSTFHFIIPRQVHDSLNP